MTLLTTSNCLLRACDISRNAVWRAAGSSRQGRSLACVVVAWALLLATATFAGPPLRYLNASPTPALSKKEQVALPARASHRVAVRVTPLHWAAIEGDADDIQGLLEAGADVNATEDFFGGERALHWAAYTGRAAAVQVLLDAGAEIDARDDAGETAVREAVRATDHGFVALAALLVAGADPEARSSSGDTALHEAVSTTVLRPDLAVHFLRLFGADPNATDNQGATPMHYAVLQPWDRFTGGTLTASPIDPHGRATPLAVARLGVKDNDGQTPLHWVASKLESAGDRRVLRWLLSQGADVNAVDGNGSTALDWAEFAGLDDLAGILRGAGGETMQRPPEDAP